MDWLAAIAATAPAGFPLARVVVGATRGSAPREPGACMLVGAEWQAGTVGGGNLEWQAIAHARSLLEAPAPGAQVLAWKLGTKLDQCCGGAVELWIERIEAADRPVFAAALQARAQGLHPALRTVLDGDGRITRQLLQGEDGAAAELSGSAGNTRVLLERIGVRRTPLWLFGAGHVGRALVQVLADLPFEVRWIDPRPAAFPDSVPANCTIAAPADPASELVAAPAQAALLVMTHSHELDYRLCAAALRRGDFAWLGLIGSDTKGTCFRVRLSRDPVCADRVHRLVSPIGLPAIRGKEPGVIAVSVAAQLLAWRSAPEAAPVCAAPIGETA